jgi:uncharacterized protein (DUF1330 family)
MTAHVAVTIRVKDREKLGEYAGQAPDTVAAHGGKFLIRGPVSEVLSGNAEYNVFALIEFPDGDTARTWYNSAEYQALIPVRDEGAEMIFTLTEAK